MSKESLLFFVVVVALLAAFFLLLAKKLGVVEWLQVHGDRIISEMAGCDFCMSFWIGTVLFVGVACFYNDPLLVFGGVLSCPITRILQ